MTQVAAHLWSADGGWLRTYREHFIKQGHDPAAAGRWRQQIEATTPWLWDRLIAPVHRHLSDVLELEAGAPVTLLPPGLLGVLPLHAAGPDPAEPCFGDFWTVTYAPRIRAHRICRDRLHRRLPIREKLLAVLDPLGSSSSEPLRTVERERAVFEACFLHADQVILSRQQATLAAVAEHLPDTTHFHVSSHGWHDPAHPARSGVQLFGGGLRLEMLQGVKLQAAPVVVLSACETGLSDIVRLPEEFIGLPTGFIQAGAASVVASLWPVRDEAALNAISHFYQACLDESRRSNAPVAAALRKAQSLMRKDPRFASPEHWAAFTVTG